jgi:hypothetical protein
MSVTAYSVYSQLPSVRRGRLFQPQHDAAQCRGDTNVLVMDVRIIASHKTSASVPSYKTQHPRRNYSRCSYRASYMICVEQSPTDGANCCEERRGGSAAICDDATALYLLVLHNVNRWRMLPLLLLVLVCLWIIRRCYLDCIALWRRSRLVNWLWINFSSTNFV